MRKKLLALATTALLLSLNLTAAQAQTTPRSDNTDGSRFEVGGHLYSFGSYDVSDQGVGGRFAYNLNRYFALEAEVNTSLNVGDESIAVNSVQGFAGIKAGHRVDKYGVFAKVRPGVVTSFTRATGPGFFDRERVNKPALDIGGVIEYYPSKRTILRLDVSDVIVAFGDDRIQEVRCPCPRRLGTTHNLGLSFGFGFRF
jgi:hypothetical protein